MQTAALTSAVEFSTAALMRFCSCWPERWCGCWSNRQFATERITIRSEGNIIYTNVASVAVTTHSFNYNLTWIK